MITLPELFISRLKNIYPDYEMVEKILAHYQQEPPLTIRVNTLRSTHQVVSDMLTGLGYTLQSVPWYSDAYIVQQAVARDLTSLEGYRNGDFFIQSLSSMIPSLVLNPSSHDTVLDMCAAPGGKTSHLAMLMGNSSSIVANDIDGARIRKMEQVLSQLGVTNVTIIHKAGQQIWAQFPEHFDKVLLDAPCSMEGRFHRNPRLLKEWSVKHIKRMAQQQKWLLRSALSATKVGGELVYSTCTISPEENEGVVSWILEKEQGAIELVDIVVEHMPLLNGIDAWESKPFHPDIAKTKRVIPADSMDAFYIARFKKVASNL